VLELTRMIADRIEGTPSKKVVTTALHVSKFILTTRDPTVVGPVCAGERSFAGVFLSMQQRRARHDLIVMS
jgi:hypothetical protein